MTPSRGPRPDPSSRSPAHQAIEAELLDQPETIACHMFGTTGYLTRDRLIAFWQGDSIVLKQPPGRRAALLRSGLGREFELRPGKPFGDWIMLPAGGPVDFGELLTVCREYVLGLPQRPARPRRAPRRRT